MAGRREPFTTDPKPRALLLSSVAGVISILLLSGVAPASYPPTTHGPVLAAGSTHGSETGPAGAPNASDASAGPVRYTNLNPTVPAMDRAVTIPPATPGILRPGADRSVAAASDYSLVTGSVVGDVDGYGAAPLLVGVNVTAYGSECSPAPATPESCPVLNWTITNGLGDFELNLSNGDYYLAALPDPAVTGSAYPDGFGGSARYVTVDGATAVTLSVYPLVPYANATLVLPEYTCDSAYLDEFGGDGPGCQNPVLSWTQSGAYYLTSANELVFYSFVNRTVSNVARWTPLYQSFPSYAMIPNELFLTQDGSYIYGWGTLKNSSATLTAEAVNVTTDRLFEFNFTGVSTSAVSGNGQVDLTGWDGNDSEFALLLANGSVIDHDLWTDVQRYVGHLDYFEANNVYWIPYLNGYIDVQADGSTADGIEEWQLTGPSNPVLTRTYKGTWASGIQVNGVNGASFNVTSRQLSVQSEWSGLTYDVNSTGALTSEVLTTNRYPSGSPPAFPIGPVAASDRPELVASGPMAGSNYAGFGNDSWLVNMVVGHTGFYTTNVSPYLSKGKIADVPGYIWTQWSQEGQFYNASYLIAPNSYQCATSYRGACTIDGGEGAEEGTIWWMWKVGSPEFPEPADSPVADVTPPAPTVVGTEDITDSSIGLDWTPPAGGPLINYTLAWGSSPSYNQYVSLGPGAQSCVLSGLLPGTRYYFSVDAWNLHYHGASAGVSSAVTGSLTYPVTFTERNLPAGTAWNVTIDSVTAASTVSTITFSEPNGTYLYTATIAQGGSSSGSFTVNGSPVKIPVTFYKATFRETGLPAHTDWQVTANGVTLSSSTHAIVFYLVNGTYGYRVGSISGFRAPAPGSLTVAGKPVTIHIRFSKTSSPESPAAFEVPAAILRRMK